jgi:hypothetical protein
MAVIKTGSGGGKPPRKPSAAPDKPKPKPKPPKPKPVPTRPAPATNKKPPPPRPKPKPVPTRPAPATNKKPPKPPKKSKPPKKAPKAVPTRPAPADNRKPPRSEPNQSVIAAQRAARARGENVRVDGVLGPKTQESINKARGKQYGAGAGAAPAPPPALARRMVRDAIRNVGGLVSEEVGPPPPLLRGDRSGHPHARQVAERKRQQERHIESRTRYVQSQRYQEQQARLHHGFLRSTYFGRGATQRPEDASAKQVRDFFFGPRYGRWAAKDKTDTPAVIGERIRKDKAGVATLQRWLRSRGHGEQSARPDPRGVVRVTGVFDAATYKALNSEIDRLKYAERQERLTAIKDAFFQTGVISKADGKQPVQLGRFSPPAGAGIDALTDINQLEPDQVLRILDRGGPMAKTLMHELMAELNLRTQKYALAYAQTAYGLDGMRVDSAREARRIFEIKKKQEEDDNKWWKDLFVVQIGSKILDGAEWISNEAQIGAIAMWEWDFREHINPLAAEAEARQIHAEFEEKHPIWAMAADFLVDPTIFIPGKWFLAPFAAMGRVTAYSAKHLDSLADEVRHADSLLAPQRAAVLSFPAKAITGPESYMNRSWRALGEAVEMHPLTGNALRIGRAATRLKSEARQAADQAVKVAAKFGFDVPGDVGATKAVVRRATGTVTHRDPINKFRLKSETLDLLRTTRGRAEEAALEPVRNLMPQLIGRRVSLYANASRGPRERAYSIVGNQIVAYEESKITAAALKSIARNEAKKAVRARQKAEEMQGLHPKQRATPDELQELYNEVEDEILRRSPLYYAGAGDPVILRLLQRNTRRRRQYLHEVLMPSWQNHIERNAIGRLFDEAEDWIDKNGTLAQALRRYARDHYDEANVLTLPNPIFGRLFDEADKQFLIDSELKTFSGRLFQQDFVNELAGNPVNPDRTAATIDERLRWIESQWEEVTPELHAPGKVWTDRRPTLRVPRLHARHLPEAFEVPGGEANWAFGKMFTAKQAQERIDDEVAQRVESAFPSFQAFGGRKGARAVAREEAMVALRAEVRQEVSSNWREVVVKYDDEGLPSKTKWVDLRPFVAPNDIRPVAEVLQRSVPVPSHIRKFLPDDDPRLVADDLISPVLNPLAQQRMLRQQPNFGISALTEDDDLFFNALWQDLDAVAGWLVARPAEDPLGEIVNLFGFGPATQRGVREFRETKGERPASSEELLEIGPDWSQYGDDLSDVDRAAILVDSVVTKESWPLKFEDFDTNGNPYTMKAPRYAFAGNGQMYKVRPFTKEEMIEGGPHVPVGADIYTEQAWELLAAKVDDFQGAMDGYLRALHRAEREALPQALREQTAYWQALRHAQGKSSRFIYYGLASTLATWRFATLPLRPGWVVRNVVDNFVKVLLQGTLDPSVWMFESARGGSVGKGLISIFDVGVSPMRAMTRFLDELFQTNATARLDAAIDVFWGQHDLFIKSFFGRYDIPIPDELLVRARRAAEGGDRLLSSWDPENSGRVIPRRDPKLDELSEAQLDELDEFGGSVVPGKVQKGQAWISSFHERVWDLLGTRPEDFYKRVLYRDRYYKALRSGKTELQAAEDAWKAVEHTLFDYSKISVIEDNFRVFFPFIQYWRKNFQFWITEMAQKPWFLGDIVDFERDLDEIHDDLPEWMRRYVSLKELADIVERVPGLKWLAPHLENARYDPLNFLSFAPLWRAFKSENELLAPDRSGIPFLGGFIDALHEWGLGANPFFRKPLELAGVLSLRSWQDIFPQTSLIEAFTRRFLNERWPNGLNIEAMLFDPLLEALGKETSTEIDAKKFNEYVQLEMAGQAARGEEINRAAAEDKIRDFLFVQGVIGYFGGTYIRRMTPEDIYYSKLAEGMATGQIDFLGLSEDQRIQYRLFKNRKWDAVMYDRYVENIPLITAYYRLSFQEGQDFLEEHPELVPFVESWYGQRNGAPPGWVQQMVLQQQTEETIRLFGLIQDADLDFRLERLARNALATPELESYWAANDTPHDLQMQMLRGQYYSRLLALNKTYYAIPDGKNSYDAKRNFLIEHPDLLRFWQHNNAESDDLRVIQNGVNGALRERYFKYLEAKDYDGAVRYLRRFPFIFENTRKAEKYRTVAKLGYFPAKTERGRAYQRILKEMEYYWSIKDPSARNAWLHSNDPRARKVLNYFNKYVQKGAGGYRNFGSDYRPGGYSQGLSQHARDYRAAKQWLDYFFGLPDSKKNEWLRGDSKGAAAVRRYFDKYADRDGKPQSQHARDFLRAKPFLDKYFNLPASRRAAWLKGDSKAAREVRRYFNKYADKGPKSQKAKDFEAAKKWLDYYFSLPESERAKWLRSGAKGTKIVQRFFDKYAEPQTQTQHAKDYLAAKSAIDYYFSLPPEERSAWLASGTAEAKKAKAYFDKYADERGQSQHAEDYLAIKPVLDGYFMLPAGPERAAYLDANPELRDYFAKYSKSQQVERAFTGKSNLTPFQREMAQNRREMQRYWRGLARRRARTGSHDPDFVVDDPDLQKRLDFWRQYYQLPPDQRPAFVAEHAEEYGVFVYGSLGEQEMADKMARWMREGFAWGRDSERSILYRHVKPLIDFYFSLPKEERELFLRANPELARYFELTRDPVSTGDPVLDGLIAQYFALPRSSRERSILLVQHPELQAWFDENSEPEDAAMHDLLEQYFKLPTAGRKQFLVEHPEVQEYFDKRQQEKANERKQLDAFDASDPRLKPFLDDAAIEIYQAAYLRKRQMLYAAVKPILLEQRRERKAKKTKRRQIVL